ncbi:HET-domain-containing protein [Lentinus tigrinus ALCF2SS1-7]|uniref:HET-domain-containing protein n=1 Tax=Lentinus tigrinus ALCF2SS1-7 TaxID=1328758 RepID=UPI0011662752|nr:HET-domain-containing protein [Lentinus tigrinus ALCF2SS1-7]
MDYLQVVASTPSCHPLTWHTGISNLTFSLIISNSVLAMWLLSTARAELHYFIGPEVVPGGYAILSHVWGDEEQTFSELRALQKTCSEAGLNPRDHASAKIQRFCELAEARGHKWGWADTCCIEKSSSSDLSEAINSMYRYYSMAEVCYAYLCDVPTGNLLDGPIPSSRKLSTQEAFARSRWHKRGWTLQELIAPDVVVFVSQDWIILGAKADFPTLLYNITGIPHGVLTLVQEPGELGIAHRMSWAANRETTRPEDEAYCLMGIFDVNMPTLYGEGRRAFRRLQEEIMKKSVDTSLFAWHKRYSHEDELVLRHQVAAAPTGQCPMDHTTKVNLFAESPKDFRWASSVTYYGPPNSSKSFDDRLRPLKVPAERLPTFTITPYGVLSSVLILHASRYTYAQLLCSDNPSPSDPSTKIILLLLVKCGAAHVHTQSLYHAVGLRFISSIADFGISSWELEAEWSDIYIIHEPSRSRREHLGAANASLTSPFRISPAALLQEVKAAGVVSISHSKLPQPWQGFAVLRLYFQGAHPATHMHIGAPPWYFTISLGCCNAESAAGDPPGARWATVARGTLRQLPHRDGEVLRGANATTHDCALDHIDGWTAHSRLFPNIIDYRLDDSEGAGDLRRVADIQLSFTPSLFPAAGTVHPFELHAEIIDFIQIAAEGSLLRVPGDDPEANRDSSRGSSQSTASGAAQDPLLLAGVEPPFLPQVPGPEDGNSGSSFSRVAVSQKNSLFGQLRKRSRSLFSLSSKSSPSPSGSSAPALPLLPSDTAR